MGWLDGEVALVTGGGSGIGRAVVERYVEEGARVCIIDLVEARVEELRSLYGDRIHGVVADVTTLEGNQRAVAEAVAAFGKLDIFIAQRRHRRRVSRDRRHTGGRMSPLSTRRSST